MLKAAMSLPFPRSQSDPPFPDSTTKSSSSTQLFEHGALERILLIAVHPDDESLAAGGLLQRACAQNAAIRIIFVTDGENNPWPQRFLERRWHLDGAARLRWGARRRDEALNALYALGLNQFEVSFWHYPDQGLSAMLLAGNPQLGARLALEIRQWKPTLVVAPSRRDLHPDHNAIGASLFFALPAPSTEEPESRVRYLEYLVHPRRQQAEAESVQLSLAPEELQRKRRAILCHRTQVALSRRRFLSYAEPIERFRVEPAARTAEPPSLWQRTDTERNTVTLSLAGLSGRRALWIATETSRQSLRLSIRRDRAGRLRLSDESPGCAWPTRNLAEINGGVELPLAELGLADADVLLVKLSGGWGGFDRTGWQCVPLPRRAPVSAGSSHRVCAVIPCYNVAPACETIIRQATACADHVLVVDDGSRDRTADVLKRLVQNHGGRVEVLTFRQNRGKGCALIAAFRHALANGTFDVIVTLDGDGQHRPEDIPRLVAAMEREQSDCAIGERRKVGVMPLRSRLGNTLTTGLLHAFFPNGPTDTQSGFRGFSARFLAEIVRQIRGGRYETELEILLLALRQRRRISTIEIPTIYLERNRLSHFRPIVDSWRIYRSLFRASRSPVVR